MAAAAACVMPSGAMRPAARRLIQRASLFSSSSNSGANYLETWVGRRSPSSADTAAPIGVAPSRRRPSAGQPAGSPSIASASATKNKPSRQRTLRIAGSSYLMPTLRLDRADTPESISDGIDLALSSSGSGFGGNAVLRSMLGGTVKQSSSSGGGVSAGGGNKRGQGWSIPIILDLAALIPDGSPHYVPPQPGTLSGIVKTLNSYGLSVVGVTNAPKRASSVSRASADDGAAPTTVLEAEAVSLGLPNIMGRGGGRAGVGGGGDGASVGVEELVSLVRTRNGADGAQQEEEQGSSSAPPASSSSSAAAFESDSKSPSLSSAAAPRLSEATDPAAAAGEAAGVVSEEAYDRVHGWSYRDLQDECKVRGLVAVGKADVLRRRLLDYLGLLGYLGVNGEDQAAALAQTRQTQQQQQREGKNEGASVDWQEQDESKTDEPSGAKVEELLSSPPASNRAAMPTPPLTSTIYRGSVRSGQQVTSKSPSSSLVIIGSVNSGGEVMSDGDIYVLGKLRGRALAGLAGGYDAAAAHSVDDKQEEEAGDEKEGSAASSSSDGARIFATSFDPELVCIGDAFTTIDDVAELDGLDGPGGAAMVSLDGDGELVFESVSL